MENLVTEVTGSAERHPGGTLPLPLAARLSCNLTSECDGASSPVFQMKAVTHLLLPVCSSINGLSGGREVVQRACFLSRLWVLQLCSTLMQPELCATRTPTNQPNHTHINRTLFRLAAKLWPS